MHAILQGHNELSKDGALGNDSKKQRSPIWSWQV